MDDIDIPILKKTYELYKAFHEHRKAVAKEDRFTIYERSENLIIDIVELLLAAGYMRSGDKTSLLEQASVNLNTLRFFVRLMKDTKAIDLKKYTALQSMIDEIGRMLGGWIRSNGSR